MELIVNHEHGVVCLQDPQQQAFAAYTSNFPRWSSHLERLTL